MKVIFALVVLVVCMLLLEVNRAAMGVVAALGAIVMMAQTDTWQAAKARAISRLKAEKSEIK